MLEIALLTLTLTHDGAVRLTLSEMENMAECEASRNRVVEILDAADVEVVSALCGETSLRLTPFEHGVDASQEIHRFRVEIGDRESFTVAPLDESGDCAADPAASPKVFCARSSQSVVAVE